jgi:hypothetical protein
MLAGCLVRFLDHYDQSTNQACSACACSFVVLDSESEPVKVRGKKRGIFIVHCRHKWMSLDDNFERYGTFVNDLVGGKVVFCFERGP